MLQKIQSFLNTSHPNFKHTLQGSIHDGILIFSPSQAKPTPIQTIGKTNFSTYFPKKNLYSRTVTKSELFLKLETVFSLRNSYNQIIVSFLCALLYQCNIFFCQQKKKIFSIWNFVEKFLEANIFKFYLWSDWQSYVIFLFKMCAL